MTKPLIGKQRYWDKLTARVGKRSLYSMAWPRTTSDLMVYTAQTQQGSLGKDRASVVPCSIFQHPTVLKGFPEGHKLTFIIVGAGDGSRDVSRHNSDHGGSKEPCPCILGKTLGFRGFITQRNKN